jgi:DNA polymerase-3 subunit epsilon
MALYKLQHWYKRKQYYRQAQRTPLAELYTHPAFSLNAKVADIDFLVADCEMSGLDPKTKELLSIGWVRISKGKIDYSSRKHILIHSSQSVGDSIQIHGLCDQRLAGASSASSALGKLAQSAKGAVLVFHHAVLDIAFIQKAAQNNFACPLLFSYVDTMQIEHKRLERSGKSAPLQLASCRDRYGLPAAFQHNAMFDAVATAELFLAQYAYLKGGADIKLGDLGIRVS